MAGRATKWPATREGVLDLIGPVLGRCSSTLQAAAELGCSDEALRGVCRAHKIDFSALLLPSAYVPRAPATGPVASPPPEPEPPPAPVEWTGARPQTTGAGFERRLIVGDVHVPFHLLRACAGVIALARAIQPHVIIQMGDFWNMGAVSHHPRPFGGRENHSRAQVQGVSFLDALARAAPHARKKLLKGNHCDWGDEYEDENPQFAGLFAAQWLGLDRIGWEVVPRARQPLVLGPVAYEHGSGGGEHYAKRYALHEAPKAGVSCYVVGHHHSMQHHRAKNGCEAWGAGWLGDSRYPAFDYAKRGGDPDHWEVGCLVQDVIGDRVTTTPVRLDGGVALFGGRLVQAA